MPMLRRTFAAAALLAACTAVPAQQPGRPLKLIVNFPPGGAADVMGRALAQQLSQQLGQPVTVENRPGANGNLGADAVAKSAPDGTTLLMSSGGAMTVNPFLYAKMPFDADRDLVPVASVARVLVYLVAHPSLAVASAAELAAHLKANPGKLSYGSAGSGSSPHLAGEMFVRALGVQATHVPYKGAAPALTDLLGGQVQFMFDPGPGLRHVRDGKLRLLAVGSSRRSSQWPDVPTLAELAATQPALAGLAGFDADTLFGVYAPAGVPAPLLAQLHAEVNKALAAPAVADVVRTIGGELAAGSREAFIERQARDRERFGAFIRQAGIKAE